MIRFQQVGCYDSIYKWLVAFMKCLLNLVGWLIYLCCKDLCHADPKSLTSLWTLLLPENDVLQPRFILKLLSDPGVVPFTYFGNYLHLAFFLYRKYEANLMASLLFDPIIKVLFWTNICFNWLQIHFNTLQTTFYYSTWLHYHIGFPFFSLQFCSHKLSWLI